MKPQGVIEVKRVTIKRDNKIIQTPMTFDLPTIPQKIKISCAMESVEKFIPNPLRCYKCQKFGYHKDKCNGRSVCGKYGEKNPDNSTEECEKTHRCANWGGDHPVYGKMEKRRDPVCKIHQKHIFPRVTEDSRRYKQR